MFCGCGVTSQTGDSGGSTSSSGNSLSISTLTLNPSSVVGGAQVTGTVTLSGAAPSGGAQVLLTSNNSAVASAPSSVTVASGQSSATFSVSTFSVSASTPTTISASYSGSSNLANLTVTTQTGPGFSISANPASVTVAPGAAGTSTVVTTVSGGFNSAISLSLTGQPSGVTATLASSSIAAPGAGTSMVLISVASSVAAGNYTLTASGTGGGQTRTAAINLTVSSSSSSANFSISSNPSSLSIAQGASASATITSTVSNGFSGSLALSSSGSPSGVTVTATPNSFAAPGTGSSTVQFAVGSGVSPGSYPITITAAGGGISRTATVMLTVSGNSQAVGDFTLTVTPSNLTVASGGNGVYSVTTSLTNGFSSSLSFSASGEPFGVTTLFNPGTIAAPGSGTIQFLLGVDQGVGAGTYPLTITATGGGVTHSTTVNLVVTVTPGSGGTGGAGTGTGPVTNWQGCWVNENGHKYQGVTFRLSSPATLPFNASLYYGGSCEPARWTDQIGFGTQISFGTFGYQYWFIHYWDQANTSAVWTVGNQTSGCIDYSKVPDCQ